MHLVPSCSQSGASRPHYTPGMCYGGSDNWRSAVCDSGRFVDQREISNDTYPVRPETVLPDVPGQRIHYCRPHQHSWPRQAYAAVIDYPSSAVSSPAVMCWSAQVFAGCVRSACDQRNRRISKSLSHNIFQISPSATAARWRQGSRDRPHHRRRRRICPCAATASFRLVTPSARWWRATER